MKNLQLQARLNMEPMEIFLTTMGETKSSTHFIDFGIPAAEFNELLNAGETVEEWNYSQPIWDEEPTTSGMSKHGANGNLLPIQDEEPTT
ncbi:hypothetical protein AVEN_32955-1 [Araneus ventricosus]|uniref:Uncharacterized protein n=1 Tax=Araneus ventricosus TaxID=182803 RepID=A0A4Y2INA8_ARAVE|nr:hypothetical protein AVEN_32955-1 [Araneus ventricosus]